MERCCDEEIVVHHGLEMERPFVGTCSCSYLHSVYLAIHYTCYDACNQQENDYGYGYG